MPLNATVLSTDMKAKLIAVFGTPEDDAELQKMTDAISQAVVDHIVANGEVLVTGVTSGGATAPGTIL